MTPHPCRSCGACCAFYRVAFYWAEADDCAPGGTPVEMTEDLNDRYRAMKGTNRESPLCVALEGTIGKAVECSIYERRPSVCREFPPSWEDGVHNERCDKARILHGLPPLTSDDWKKTDAPLNPAA